MAYVFKNSSLLSSIAAIDFVHNLNCEVHVKSGELSSCDRYYSINEFSKIYLNKLGIWENLEISRVIPYSEIEIYLNSMKSIIFDANEINISTLGYIVHEGDLVSAVSRLINSSNKIIKYDKRSYSNSTKDINILSSSHDAECLQEVINYSKHDYNQTAMNITFNHEIKNERKPRQVFYNNEILGLLPIDNQSYNLIWSVPNAFHKDIEKSSKKDIMNILVKRIGFITGKINKITLGGSFPLTSRHADKYFYENNLLIGEAAHKYHPLAGLGLNMGIEDVATLSHLLTNIENSKTVFYEYAISRMSRAQSLQHILDTIIVFHSSNIMPVKIKKKILGFFNETFYLKPKIIENATGLINKDLVNL